MKTPSFWKDENIISFLLYPFSLVYGVCRNLHVIFSTEYRTNLHIICIGNMTAGGSGKTPLAIKVGKILKEEGVNFAYLTKGYRGAFQELVKVDLSKNTAAEVGDEALLLVEVADTFVAKNRRIAIEKLSKEYKYKTIVMDDGFQNPTIFKDKNIVVIDGEYGVGNGELLPAGPLRETVVSAMRRADFFVIVGQDRQNFEEKLLNNGIGVARAYIKEKANKIDKTSPYIAFCGIGRCEKFFNSLKKVGYNVVEELSFSDHYNYDEEDIKKILLESEKRGTKIITTKKDWVRLADAYRKNIEYLDIDMEFYNEENFKELLLK